jgi:hypothetical protein
LTDTKIRVNIPEEVFYAKEKKIYQGIQTGGSSDLFVKINPIKKAEQPVKR